MRRGECPVCGHPDLLFADYGEEICTECVVWMYRLPEKYQSEATFPIERMWVSHSVVSE